MICLYPAALRREFHRELLVTFRNRAEDVLNSGSLLVALLFLVHIGADWLRTSVLDQQERPTLSLLGLGAEDDQACGCVDVSTVSVSLMLASLGVVLLVVGWYCWLSLNAAIMSHHRAI